MTKAFKFKERWILQRIYLKKDAFKGVKQWKRHFIGWWAFHVNRWFIRRIRKKDRKISDFDSFQTFALDL